MSRISLCVGNNFATCWGWKLLEASVSGGVQAERERSSFLHENLRGMLNFGSWGKEEETKKDSRVGGRKGEEAEALGSF